MKSQNEYLEIKKFIDSYYYHKKKFMYIFPQNRYKEFHEKIIKSYFNIWYIKFFYL